MRVWINRRFHFMGKWLRHAYYPNWNLRLFQHRLGRYEQLTETETHSGDNEVHEHVVVKGPTARLNVEMDHHAFPSVEVFVEKHNRYSNWEARVWLLRESSAGELPPTLFGNQAQRRRWLRKKCFALPGSPALFFFYKYVLCLGFLDGKEGFIFHFLQSLWFRLLVDIRREEMESANPKPSTASSHLTGRLASKLRCVK